MKKLYLEVLMIVFCILAIATPLIIFLPKGTAESEPFRCKGGYLFVRSTGYQLFNEAGGGIKCEKEK